MISLFLFSFLFNNVLAAIGDQANLDTVADTTTINEPSETDLSIEKTIIYSDKITADNLPSGTTVKIPNHEGAVIQVTKKEDSWYSGDTPVPVINVDSSSIVSLPFGSVLVNPTTEVAILGDNQVTGLYTSQSGEVITYYTSDGLQVSNPSVIYEPTNQYDVYGYPVYHNSVTIDGEVEDNYVSKSSSTNVIYYWEEDNLLTKVPYFDSSGSNVFMDDDNDLFVMQTDGNPALKLGDDIPLFTESTKVSFDGTSLLYNYEEGYITQGGSPLESHEIYSTTSLVELDDNNNLIPVLKTSDGQYILQGDSVRYADAGNFLKVDNVYSYNGEQVYRDSEGNYLDNKGVIIPEDKLDDLVYKNVVTETYDGDGWNFVKIVNFFNKWTASISEAIGGDSWDYLVGDHAWLGKEIAEATNDAADAIAAGKQWGTLANTLGIWDDDQVLIEGLMDIADEIDPSTWAESECSYPFDAGTESNVLLTSDGDFGLVLEGSKANYSQLIPCYNITTDEDDDEVCDRFFDSGHVACSEGICVDTSTGFNQPKPYEFQMYMVEVIFNHNDDFGDGKTKFTINLYGDEINDVRNVPIKVAMDLNKDGIVDDNDTITLEEGNNSYFRRTGTNSLIHITNNNSNEVFDKVCLDFQFRSDGLKDLLDDYSLDSTSFCTSFVTQKDNAKEESTVYDFLYDWV